MNNLKSSRSRIFIDEVDEEAQSLSVHDHENELLEELMMKDSYSPRPLHFLLEELHVKAKEKANHPLQTTPSSSAACHKKSSSSVLQDKKLDHQVDRVHDQDQDELDALLWDDFCNPRPLHFFLEELNKLNDKQKSTNGED